MAGCAYTVVYVSGSQPLSVHHPFLILLEHPTTHPTVLGICRAKYSYGREKTSKLLFERDLLATYWEKLATHFWGRDPQVENL